jgi:hypothetical protein
VLDDEVHDLVGRENPGSVEGNEKIVRRIGGRQLVIRQDRGGLGQLVGRIARERDAMPAREIARITRDGLVGRLDRRGCGKSHFKTSIQTTGSHGIPKIAIMFQV